MRRQACSIESSIASLVDFQVGFSSNIVASFSVRFLSGFSVLTSLTDEETFAIIVAESCPFWSSPESVSTDNEWPLTRHTTQSNVDCHSRDEEILTEVTEQATHRLASTSLEELPRTQTTRVE